MQLAPEMRVVGNDHRVTRLGGLAQSAMDMDLTGKLGKEGDQAGHLTFDSTDVVQCNSQPMIAARQQDQSALQRRAIVGGGRDGDGEDGVWPLSPGARRRRAQDRQNPEGLQRPLRPDVV